VKYTREEILEIWKSILKVQELTSHEFESIKSTDVWYSPELGILCPKCRKDRKILLYINRSWQCTDCHQIKKGRKGIFWTDFRLAYRLTNDLEAYLGEITSEKLFDSELVKAFVRFNKLENNARVYVLLLQLVKTILSREVGALKIIDYISEAEAKIKIQNVKRATNIGTDKSADTSTKVAP